MSTAGAGGQVSWAERAAKLTFQTGLYIDGAYVAAADGATLPV